MAVRSSIHIAVDWRIGTEPGISIHLDDQHAFTAGGEAATTEYRCRGVRGDSRSTLLELGRKRAGFFGVERRITDVHSLFVGTRVFGDPPRTFGVEHARPPIMLPRIIDERPFARQIDWPAGVPNSPIDLAHTQEISANGRIAGD